METNSTLKMSGDSSVTEESSHIGDKEIDISTFSQQSSWKVSVNFHHYEGFWIDSFSLKGVILFQKNFVPQANDFVLCTPPKSGTTWLKALCFAISTRNQSPDSLLTQKMPHDIVPFQEMLYLLGQNRDIQNPLVSTHVAFTSLPKSILNSSSTKIIYLCRNPKDVLVSLWLFLTSIRNSNVANIISFQEAYEKFCNGVSAYGPYWDHVLSYWKASLEFPDKVLFLKYEDLKNDASFNVKKMADFMHFAFSDDEQKQGMVEKIVQLCSFENLSNLEVNKSENKSIQMVSKIQNSGFFRKGKTGDWKNYLTDEMAEKIDKITREKLSRFGLYI
ncbi:Cytosolic sulfotransferase 17 [Euphorbia peplus]|nr:Cytosolic sulfotransferase 17 [Euphorbia peplus]